MIDTGSSMDIIFKDALDRCQLRQPCFYSCTTPLYGFTGDSLMPVGSIILPVAIGEPPKQVNNMVEFVVVDIPSAYNMILGRPFLSKIRGVLSIYHNVLKFPVDNEVGTLRGDQQMARKCYAVSSNPAALAKQCSQITTGDTRVEPGRVEGSGRVSPQETGGTPDSQPEQTGSREEPPEEDDEGSPDEEVAEEEERGGPAEELEEVVVREGEPARTVKMGSTLTPEHKAALQELLQEYNDVFAWSHEEMPGIPTHLASHRLNVDPTFKPVKQKKEIFQS